MCKIRLFCSFRLFYFEFPKTAKVWAFLRFFLRFFGIKRKIFPRMSPRGYALNCCRDLHPPGGALSCSQYYLSFGSRRMYSLLLNQKPIPARYFAGIGTGKRHQKDIEASILPGGSPWILYGSIRQVTTREKLFRFTEFITLLEFHKGVKTPAFSSVGRNLAKRKKPALSGFQEDCLLRKIGSHGRVFPYTPIYMPRVFGRAGGPRSPEIVPKFLWRGGIISDIFWSDSRHGKIKTLVKGLQRVPRIHARPQAFSSRPASAFCGFRAQTPP